MNVNSLTAFFCVTLGYCSLAYEPDEGLDEWLEDVFETQTRLPLSNWPTGIEHSYWSDVVSLDIVFSF